MAKRKTRRTSSRSRKKKPAPRVFVRRVLRWMVMAVVAFVVAFSLLMGLGRVVAPWTTPYMFSESRRLAGVDYDWVPMDRISPVMARSVVAAEDANFCAHWGFDLAAIRDAIEGGGGRGASTISQQVVKNLYLWHGRNYTRKALEAVLTPGLEAIWPKRRIVEVYLNIAEFDEGVFGVGAAARHYFGVEAADLSATQAARLAAVLPDPKGRSASRPSDFVQKRARAIADGAALIRKDGRAACFDS